MTKFAQIQEVIRLLPPAEQQELRHWLMEEESPALLAAVDEGMRSLVEVPTFPLEEVRPGLWKLAQNPGSLNLPDPCAARVH